MTKTNSKYILSGILSLMLIGSFSNAFAATEKITNGGFEAPDVPLNPGWGIFATPVNGWNVAWNPGSGCIPGETGFGTAGMLEIHDNVLTFGGALATPQYAELDGDCQGPTTNNSSDNGRVQTTISQNIQTCSNGVYDLSFYYHHRASEFSPTTDGLLVTWGGVDITPALSWDNTWKQATVTGLVGDGTLKTLAFKDTGFADALGTLVDEVSLLETCSEIQVAGELVPLNTTALFVSGLSSSMIWMVPTLAGIAGVGAYYVKSKKN